MAFAEQGITELSKHVDSLITIPNDKLHKVWVLVSLWMPLAQQTTC